MFKKINKLINYQLKKQINGLGQQIKQHLDFISPFAQKENL